MQKEKTTTEPKTVAALPNEILFKILCLIKKDHVAEMSHWSHVYCTEAFKLEATITALRNKIKHNALKARFAADRHLFRRQSGGGRVAKKYSLIIRLAAVFIVVGVFDMFLLSALINAFK